MMNLINDFEAVNKTKDNEKNQKKVCIKCNCLKNSDDFKNKWRPNICVPCLKQDAKDKYLKARVTKDMCDDEKNKDKWDLLKSKRDKKRDDIGKYVCDTCKKDVALKYKAKHESTNYHIKRLNIVKDVIVEDVIVDELVPITLQKRSTDNTISESIRMITPEKRDKILEILMS